MGLNQSKKKPFFKFRNRPTGNGSVLNIEERIFIDRIKIGIFGDEKVGKTSICNSFLNMEFQEDVPETIGCEKYKKKKILKEEKEINLIIWDTAGNERFHSFVLKCIKACQGIILVFDVTNRKSFDDLEDWILSIKENMQDPLIILFGNKVDLDKEKWIVNEEEIERLVKKENLKYFDVSAKSCQGIDEGFTYFANKIYDKLISKH